MRRVVVSTMDGEPVGMVAVEADGRVFVQGETPDRERQLAEIVNLLMASPLACRTGKKEETSAGSVYHEYLKFVGPEDRDFPRALADALFGHTVSGKRIAGVVDRAAGAQTQAL